MKKVDFSQAIGKKFPEWVVMVTSIDARGKPNVMPAGWFSCCSSDPPIITVAISHSSYTNELIAKNKEFAVCFPSESQKKDVLFCGSHSGRVCDKFEKSNLSPLKADKITPPLIGGSVACFECDLSTKLEAGDHTIFAGEVVASWIGDKSSKKLYNLGNHRLITLKEEESE